MSLRDKLSKFDEKIEIKEIPKIKTPIPRKVIIPENVKIAWNQISKSIEGVWGKVQKDGNRKWDSKYAHYLIVKQWIDSLL